MNKTLSICIATYNSKRFVKDCLESILKQSVWHKKDFDIKIGINVVDNGSQDETVEFIQNNYSFVHLLQNVNNLGFSRAYNQAIKMQEADLFLIMNADVILEKDYLENLLKKVAQSGTEKVGVWGGKILRVHTQTGEDGLQDLKKTHIIDSCGLEVKKSRQVKNIGEGQKDEGQFDNLEKVFGFSGCCFLISKKALEDVKYKEEYFDEDFFAYQEDFDLAYRLQLFGWQANFVKDAVCYHFRSAKLHTLKPWLFWKIIQARREKSQIANYHSYKNHWWLLYKNELAGNFWKDFIFIFWFEFRKVIYLLFFENKSLKSLKEDFKKNKKMKAKRFWVMERRRVGGEEIGEWMK